MSDEGRDRARVKSHCKRGHALTPDNVRLLKLRNGYTQRNCRKCSTVHSRARKTRGRVEAFYEPLDEVLSSPTLRVLRVMRRFDWITTQSICDVLDIADVRIQNNVSGTVRHLLRSGCVEQDGSSYPPLYRITLSGTSKLQRIYDQYVQGLDAVELSDEELQEAA